MKSMDVKWPMGLRGSFINKFEHEWLLKHAGTGKPADGSSLSPKLKDISGGITVPLCSGLDISTPTDVPPIVFQSDNVRNNCHPKETRPLQRDLSSLRNSILRSDGVICHTLKSCQVDSGDVEIQMSEICQKRFVMFDHTGSKKRIIMHPAMVDNFPAFLSLSCGDHLGYLENINVRAVSNMKETMVTPPGGRSAANYHELNFNLKTGLFSSNGYLDAQTFEINNTGQTLNNPESSDDFHENTEELDALMSSDYETSSTSEMSSTGHSPSDMTHSNTPDIINVMCQSILAGRKGKRALDGYGEKDTDDTATSGTFLNRTYYNYPINWGRVSDYGKDGYTVFDLSYSDKTSSCSSSNNQRLHKTTQSRVHSPTDNEAKKQRIKETIHVLCDILPASESVGSAFILDQAIQLV